VPHTDPIPETLSSVPGYPNTLQIYMMPASSYWQVRAYVGNTLVRRSTKTDVRSKAIAFCPKTELEPVKPLPDGSSSAFRRVSRAV
jgi:hypothetical protein